MTFYSVSNPFPLVLNRQGTGLNDGDVYFGVAGQDPITHPKTVYWNIGGTDAADQPIPTTGGYYYRSGTPANVFVDSTYSIKVLDKNGDQVFYAANVYDPVFQIAADLAAFEASLAAPTGSDLVGHDANILGSIATTVGKKLREFKSVKSDFGAVGDNTADDTAAFVKARTYANSVGGNCTIWIPDGAYKITGAVGSITVPGVCWIGSSNGGAVLNLSYDGPAFTYTGYAGGFENLQVSYPSAPGSNAVFLVQDGATGQNLKNMRINNVRTFVQIGTPAGASSGALTVSGLNGNIYNGGSALFNLYTGNGLFVINAGVFVNGVGVPITNRTSTMTTVSGTSFIKTNNKTFDTIVIGTSCILERWWRILDFVTAGTGDLILNVFVDPTIIVDYCRDDVYHLESVLGSGGIINAVVGGYANSWEGRSVNIIANSNARAIDIVGLNCAINGYEAVKISGPNATRIRMDRPRSVAADRLNTGVSDINITTGDHIELIGGIIGENGTFGGSPWQGAYGLSVAADINFLTVADTDSDGATGPYNFTDNTTASGNRRIRDNVNATYAGIKSTGVYTLPASGVAWQNKSGFEVDVTIGGGTVTVISRNGTTTGLIAGTLTILPGDYFTLTYSVAPTIQFYVKP